MSTDFKQTLTLNMPGLDQHARPGDSISTRCDVLSYYWGINATGRLAGAPRQVYISEISMTRYTDAGTPVLARLCQTGVTLPHVTLTVRSEKDGKTVFEMVMEMINARVCNVRPTGAAADSFSRPMEDLTFEFEKLKMNVTEGETRAGSELTPQNP